MYDCHLHLLPGIDDGPETIAESLEMCRTAAADGIRGVIATPHQQHPSYLNGDIGMLKNLCDELRNEAGEMLDIHLGAEIRVTWELFDLLPRRKREAPRSSVQLKIENSKLRIERLIPISRSTLLLEFSSIDSGINPREIVHELVIAGWRPVLAHPERINWMADSPSLLPELVKLGALLQLTAQSVTGDFGGRVQQRCEEMLDHDLVHFVASDAHNTTTRPPVLSRAFETISQRWDQDLATKLLISNPRNLIEDSWQSH